MLLENIVFSFTGTLLQTTPQSRKGEGFFDSYPSIHSCMEMKTNESTTLRLFSLLDIKCSVLKNVYFQVLVLSHFIRTKKDISPFSLWCSSSSIL